MANQHETVCAAIQATFEGISTSDGYVYPPDAVHRIVFLPDEWAPDATYQTVYYFWPSDPEESAFGPSSCEITARLPISVLACRRLVSATENPSAGVSPERWQAGAEMAADIKQAVFADPKFTSTARRIIGDQITTDYQRYLPGWALVEVRFVVEYATDRPGR